MHKSKKIQSASIILPLAVDKLYNYLIPDELSSVQVGCRVEVQFGSKKRYAGIVYEIIEVEKKSMRFKNILAIIDHKPLVNANTLKLWDWIANYYMTTLGEVMIAALPAVLKMSSESIITATELVHSSDMEELSDDEFLVIEALQSRPEITITEIQLILQKKKVLGVIESLSGKRFLTVNELLKDQYVPKKIEWVSLAEKHKVSVEYDELFDSLKRAPKQSELLLGYFQYSQSNNGVLLKKLLKKTNSNRTVINALVNKGVFEITSTLANRMTKEESHGVDDHEPDAQQTRALDEIKGFFNEGKPVLLHGVTGSGKTRVYVELIKQQIIQGKQTLFLVPEIALTTQLEERLKNIFGSQIIPYHSRLNNQERVDAWRLVTKGFPIVLAARSGLFLPFKKLGLIIVDESHDSSYKQHHPAPRYNGRDTAFVLAKINKSKLILGTATPSLDSVHNVREEKIGMVEMNERYGDSHLPNLEIIHLAKDRPLDIDSDIFSQTLLDEIENALAHDKQIILFQNRRGYSPLLICGNCDWKAECINCDVSLTVHKYHNFVQCHYCNYKTTIPPECPQCKCPLLKMTGFGTQKVQKELKDIFPEVTIDRLDYDNTRQKKAFQNIINRFAVGDSSILVGTQMITKGLDFENVAIVGILQADQALFYPEYRASERGLQLLLQVSGRAGRRSDQGKVIVQTHRPEHLLFQYLKNHRYMDFVMEELKQREVLDYPPSARLIRITIRHKDPQICFQAATSLSTELKSIFGSLASSVAPNHIPRINNLYIYGVLLKMPKGTVSPIISKKHLANIILQLRAKKEYRSVRFLIDIDPI